MKVHFDEQADALYIRNETTEPWRIVTAYFDRSQRNQL
jgi:uncharacterized protein YuzE